MTFDDGHVALAWVYLYNAPLGRAQRIDSGDYLQYPKVLRRAKFRASAERAGSERAPAVFDGVHELQITRINAVGRFDELDPRLVRDEVLIDVTDAAVRDAPLDDDGAVAEREAEIVERVEL